MGTGVLSSSQTCPPPASRAPLTSLTARQPLPQTPHTTYMLTLPKSETLSPFWELRSVFQLPDGCPLWVAQRHLKFDKSEPNSFSLVFHHLAASHLPVFLPSRIFVLSWPISTLPYS